MNEIQAIQSGGGMLTAYRDLEQMYNFSTYIAKSQIVPKTFQGDPGGVMIALNMAQRLRMDPLMVMQNIVLVNGNAGVTGKFAIALLNRSPKYKRIEYRYLNGRDYKDGIQVVGYRVDDNGKNPDIGTAITMDMAKAEGWTKNQKWSSMTEQMMKYRAAAFFARAFAPDELMGMQTAEELEDVAMAGGRMRNVTPERGRLEEESDSFSLKVEPEGEEDAAPEATAEHQNTEPSLNL